MIIPSLYILVSLPKRIPSHQILFKSHTFSLKIKGLIETLFKFTLNVLSFILDLLLMIQYKEILKKYVNDTGHNIQHT